MSTTAAFPHIVIDADQVARIDQTRYKVAHLAAEHYHYGWSAEELLRQHPDLKPEQVYAALTYFYDHHDHMVAHFETEARNAEASSRKQTLSRNELMKRRPPGMS